MTGQIREQWEYSEGGWSSLFGERVGFKWEVFYMESLTEGETVKDGPDIAATCVVITLEQAASGNTDNDDIKNIGI